MIASLHLADVGRRSAVRALRSRPDPESVPGLRHADVALAGLLSGSFLPRPDLGRVGLVAFWDGDDDLDRFLDDHPLAATLDGGWRVRLTPLRAFGAWPGLPDDVPLHPLTEHDGPTAVLTLGRLRITQALRFLRASAKAEARVVEAQGLTWASGLARPPFVSTASLWHTTGALSDYAYGLNDSPHQDVIDSHLEKPFHHQSAFIRFAPYRSEGSLDGRNPLPEDWMSSP